MKLYCEKYPDAAKHDTLFIHGNLASTNWWKPTLSEWQKQISPGKGALLFADWRGCGQNPPWNADLPFTLQDLAEDFLQMLEGKEQVDLVGHSLGGLIALQMLILNPKRFRRAVLLDPVGARGVVFDDSMYEAFKQMALNRELTKTVILSTIRGEEKLQPPFKEQLADDAFKAIKGIGTSVLEILKTVNLEAEAKKVQTPTLVLHGQHDQIIPLRDAQSLAQTLPKATLEVLPEAGHCWNVENPTGFVKRLKDWF